MKRTAATILAVTAVALIGLWGISQAQSGGGFDLSWNVIAGGGGTSEGGGYSLSGTIGQATTSESSGGGYTLQSGFWPGVAAPCSAPDATAAVVSTNVRLTWSAGTYNVYRAVDDPYFSTGAQIGTGASSPFDYADALLGVATNNAYYLVGPTATCGDRLGEFDFGIAPGTP